MIAVNLRFGIERNIVVDKAVQLGLFDLTVAAPFHHIAGHIFQQIVNKGADFRRFKAGASALLGPQAVLHEVAEMALLHLIHAGGRHTDTAAVERAHRLRRQPAALYLLGPLHSEQGAAVGFKGGEIPP